MTTAIVFSFQKVQLTSSEQQPTHRFCRTMFFLSNVATIPVNLQYNAWFVPIDPTNNSETDLISLYDNLLCPAWFLQVESVTCSKCFVVTTWPNLLEARAWINTNLELLIWQSIPPGIDPPASLLPCHLNKPIYMVSSQTYADIFKKQFSLASNPATPATARNKPPHKHQAAIIDYNSNQSAESPISNVTAVTQTSLTCTTTPTTATNNAADYTTEILSLKNEIASLQTTIATELEQLKNAIKSLITPPCKPEPNVMDTNDETMLDAHQ